MKVWDKRFKERKTNPLLEDYNSSIEQDQFLYQEEIEGSQAYAKALYKAAVLSEKELKEILSGLRRVKKKIERGENIGQFEDIHSAVELLLTDEIGAAGKKLHSGRSRNEQVVNMERLYLKKKIPQIVTLVEKIQKTLTRLAEENFNVLFPGYTHLQQAQCVLFSHYLMALFWPLERGKVRLRQVLKRVNTLSLGVGALAGCSLPLDREYMRRILHFNSVSENSMDTVTDRSYILEALFVFSLILLDISRYAEDFIIFSSNEFGYLEMDDSLVTSSSLMPQKRNPDFLELIRASGGMVFGYFSSLFMIIKGLPSTYNKDLQQDKFLLKRGVDETIRTLEVFIYVLNHIRPVAEKILAKMSPLLLTTDLVDYLMEKKMPFREAHAVVGELVEFAQKRDVELNHLPLGDFKIFSDLFEEDVFAGFVFENSVKRKKTYGSTHPEFVKGQINKAKHKLKHNRKNGSTIDPPWPE